MIWRPWFAPCCLDALYQTKCVQHVVAQMVKDVDITTPFTSVAHYITSMLCRPLVHTVLLHDVVYVLCIQYTIAHHHVHALYVQDVVREVVCTTTSWDACSQTKCVQQSVAQSVKVFASWHPDHQIYRCKVSRSLHLQVDGVWKVLLVGSHSAYSSHLVIHLLCIPWGTIHV